MKQLHIKVTEAGMGNPPYIRDDSGHGLRLWSHQGRSLGLEVEGTEGYLLFVSKDELERIGKLLGLDNDTGSCYNMRMSKQKMLKYQKGRYKPTENRAINSLTNQDVDFWVRKIDEAASTTMINEKIRAVADVLSELGKEIKAGKVSNDVLFGVVRRRNISASLALLYDRGEW